MRHYISSTCPLIIKEVVTKTIRVVYYKIINLFVYIIVIIDLIKSSIIFHCDGILNQ